MKITVKQLSILMVFLFPLSIAGCATVPKEVVQLSYTVGQDIEAVHVSYKALIREHFDSLRTQTTTYIDTRWTPAYLGDFIKSGDLVAMAKDPDPLKAFEGVSTWAEVAIEDIEKKKKELLTPIEQDERALQASVDDAFARLIRANATITAHLNSIRKVQEVQDETLKSLKLADLRDEVNQKLIDASRKAETALTKLEGVKSKVNDLSNKKKELLEKTKGGTGQ
ncbi:MAG TPA: hypothetical protein VGK27_06840 [Candidatus Deferrimicrobiaceae bacterium]|jgi:hypothetical protein